MCKIEIVIKRIPMIKSRLWINEIVDIIIVKQIQSFLYLEGGKSHGSCS